MKFLAVVLILVSPLCHANRTAMTQTLAAAASRTGLPPSLLIAICDVESNLNPKAINKDDGHGDSIGLCQVKLKTARWIGCANKTQELFVARWNARCAARYLAFQLKRYKGNVRYAVSAYNMGRVRFNRSGKLLNRRYVNLVMKKQRKLKHVRNKHKRAIGRLYRSYRRSVK